jgi:hypothetical protein
MSKHRIKFMLTGGRSYDSNLANDSEDGAAAMLQAVDEALVKELKFFRTNHDGKINTIIVLSELTCAYAWVADVEKEERDKERERVNAETYTKVLQAQLKSYQEAQRGEKWRGDDEED